MLRSNFLRMFCDSRCLIFVVRYHDRATEEHFPPVIDFGPPSPEALAWKSTSAGKCVAPPILRALIQKSEMAPGGADYLLAYAAMRAQQPISRSTESAQSSPDIPSRPSPS
jgi:hypothetical protein